MGNLSLRINGKRISSGLFLISLIALIPPTLSHYQAILANIPADIRHLTATTAEEKKLEAYGQYDLLGYGYLEKVLDGVPDLSFSPLIRYHYFGLPVNLLLPGQRYVPDKRMLVGIALQPEDVRESVITSASRITQSKTQNGILTGWTFTTTWEYDLLSGMVLHLRGASDPSYQIKATMLESPSRLVPVQNWSWPNVSASDALHLDFRPPLTDVYGRGSLPFILWIEMTSSSQNPKVPELTGLDILGTKVNTAGYRTVHQENGCFTALQIPFLDAIVRDNSTPWHDYLRKLTNVPEITAMLSSPQKEEKP